MKTLKNYLTILFMFLMVFISKCHSQGYKHYPSVSLSVLQDVKLGAGLDSKHNYNKSVLDLIVNVNLEGKQLEYYYFAVQLQFETANLRDSNLYRYGVNLMWNFNELVIDRATIGVGVGGHMINRDGMSSLSYGALSDISYRIDDNFWIITKHEFYRRTDLMTPHTGYNLALGVKYKF